MSVLPQNRNSAQYSVPIMIMGGTEPSDFSHVMRILTKQLKVLGTDGCDATLFSSEKKNIKLFFGCSCMDFEALVKFRSAFGKNHTMPCAFCTWRPPRGIYI